MSNAKEQQKTRPKMDEIVGTILVGENLENASNLMAFCKENKMSLRWASLNCWQFYFKSKRIGQIRITDKDNSWTFSPWNSVDTIETLTANDIKAKDIVWSSVKLCNNCCNCGPGHDRIVFDKMFEKVCHGWFRMTNPNEATIDFIKQMLKEKMSQLAIATSKH